MLKPRCSWVVIPIVPFFAGSIAGAQGEKDFHSNAQIQLEKFILHQGLPGGSWGRKLVSVGKPFGGWTTTEQDKSGKLIYVRTIAGQSRWLPDNVIEITLNIDENGVSRTETIRLQDFQTKTILLRKLPRNRREELRLIPEFLEPQLALTNSQ